MRTVEVTVEVDDEGLAELRRPRSHPAVERPAGPDRFVLERGPFTIWERTLAVEPLAPASTGEGETGARHRVTTTTTFAVAVPLWGFLFTPLIAGMMRRSHPGDRNPWFLPPDIDARGAGVLGILCVFSLYTGYLGVLLSQTNAFFQRDFGSSNTEIADAQVVLRVGALAALLVVALADRRGRRRILLLSTFLGIVLAATGALAPNLPLMTLSQGVARVFSAAIGLLVLVIATEEVGPRSRAFAVSVLALTAALGAGGVVAFLWVGDLTTWSWRIFFVVPLPFLATLPWLARRLPETRRFEVFDVNVLHSPAPGTTPEPGPGPVAPTPVPVVDTTGAAPGRRREHLGRLVTVGSALLLLNVFVIPQAAFANNYLLNERAFSGGQIALFQVLTNVPGGAAIVLGGQLADRFGRRLVAAVGAVGSAVGTVGFYVTDGWTLWAWATASTLFSAVLIPALGVYPAELFPTGKRGRSNGITNVLAVTGSAIGLRLCGVLADRFGSFGPAITILAAAPLLVAVIVVAFFPETAGRELEEINPEDSPPPGGADLARLDERWTREHGVPADGP